MKYHITSITPVLQDFADFFSIILSLPFNMFLFKPNFGDCKSLIEWNMKVKIEVSICTGLMLNDHSNPYIESTTVLSDIEISICTGLMLNDHSNPYIKSTTVLSDIILYSK